MVRTINEPLPTPARPSVASESLRIPSTLQTASRIPIRPIATRPTPAAAKGRSIPLPRPSTVKKRAVLGEREDNTFFPPPTSAPKRKSRPSQIVVNHIQTAPVPPPTRASPTTWSIRAPSAASSTLQRPPRPSFTRLDAGMDEDVTQLLDIQPSSPTAGTTDGDWFSGTKEVGNVTAGRTPMPRKSSGWGKAIEGGGRMMTPINSQEVQVSIPLVAVSLPKRNPVSRLPTPPSSQPSEPALTPQRPSPPNRRRARPTPTPPRSSHPAEIAAAEPSPNPRVKKNPRLASLGSVNNLRQSLTPGGSALVPVSSATKAKGKGRASTAKSRASAAATQPPAEPDSSQTPPTASQSRRKSVASTKKRSSPKPRARKSRSTTPPSALARYAGVDPRRKSFTPAALRRITGRDLEIGAGVNSVESSPSDDPLLLKPNYGSDTEVDEEEEAPRRARSSTLVGGSQTEPRLKKGKGRASGMGFSQSSIKSALSKSTLSNTSSKAIVCSFPFKPYTNAPPPPRNVPEWVPRTMKKKKVELEYNLEDDAPAVQDMGNRSFDFDAGRFGSDGDSDFGDGYTGDDTFMNIMTRRDGAGGAMDAGRGPKAATPEEVVGRAPAGSSRPSVTPRHSPPPRLGQSPPISPASSPLSTQHLDDAGPSRHSSPAPIFNQNSRTESPSSRSILHESPLRPSPHPVVEDEFEEEDTQHEYSVLGLSHMDLRISPSPRQPVEEHFDATEVEDEGAAEEMDTTDEADTTAEGVSMAEADTTVDAVSESWDESADSIALNILPDEGSLAGMAEEASSGESNTPMEAETTVEADPMAEGNSMVEADVTVEAVSDSWDESAQSIALNLLPHEATLPLEPDESMEAELEGTEDEEDFSPADAAGVGLQDNESLSPAREIAQVDQVEGPVEQDRLQVDEFAKHRTSDSRSASPITVTQTVPVTITETFSSFSPRTTPPRSPFRLLQHAGPPTPVSVPATSIILIAQPPLISRTPSHLSQTTASPSPRRVQSFDEAARSSLSSSQIAESDGDVTVDAIESGWESDESVVVNGVERAEDPEVGAEEAGEEVGEISDMSAAAEAGGEVDISAEIAMNDSMGEQPDDEVSDSVLDPDVEADTSVPPTDGAAPAPATDGVSSQSPYGAPAPQEAVSNPPADTAMPAAEAGDGKIVLGLITRIIKQEPEDSSDEESEDEQIGDEEEEYEEYGGEEQAEDEDEEGEQEEEQEEEKINSGQWGRPAAEYGEAELDASGDDGDETLPAEEESSISSIDVQEAPLPITESTPLLVAPVSAPAASPRKLPNTPSRVHVPISTTPLMSPPRSMLTRDAAQASSAALSTVVAAAEEPSALTRQRTRSPAPAPTPSLAPSVTAPSALATRRRSGTTLRPSGLSHQITGDTPESSPARPAPATEAQASAEMSTSSSSGSSDKVSESPFVDEGVSVRSAGKSLLAELARAGGKGKQKELRGVVEVSSLDPRAAARAAAILKMNHNYIEHGILPSSSDSQSTSQAGPSTTPKKLHHSRRKSYTSHHFDSVASARKLSPEELLNEAELEIVVNETDGVPTPGRRMREGTAFSAVSGVSGLTNFPVPGGWVRTPKRKRSRAVSSEDEEEQSQPAQAKEAGKSWGIPEWKRLEKVYKEEKAAWVKEREVKAMPGGLMAWAKRSTGIGMPSEAAKVWDDGRVVRRFLELEGAEEGKGGAWAEDVILLRIQALERRLASRPSSSEKRPVDGSPKKRAKVGAAPPITPLKAGFGRGAQVPPPSAMKRVLGWVWGSSFTPTAEAKRAEAAGFEALQPPAISQKGKARDEGERPHSNIATARSDPRSILPMTAPNAAPPQPMKQVSTRPASILPPPPRSTLPRLSGRTTIETSTSTSTAVPTIPAAAAPGPTTAPAPAKAPTPLLAASTGDTSASHLGLSTSSSATSGTFPPQTPRIYPQLSQSISQRSAAIKALFPAMHPLGDSTSSTASTTSAGNSSRVDASFARTMAINALNRKTSVKDLAKSFEEKGVLDNALRRVPSGSSEVEALKRVMSRERK